MNFFHWVLPGGEWGYIWGYIIKPITKQTPSEFAHDHIISLHLPVPYIFGTRGRSLITYITLTAGSKRVPNILGTGRSGDRVWFDGFSEVKISKISRWFNSWPNFIPYLEVTNNRLKGGHVNSPSQKRSRLLAELPGLRRNLLGFSTAEPAPRAYVFFHMERWTSNW